MVLEVSGHGQKACCFWVYREVLYDHESMAEEATQLMAARKQRKGQREETSVPVSLSGVCPRCLISFCEALLSKGSPATNSTTLWELCLKYTGPWGCL